MARATVTDEIRAGAVAARRGPALWRLLPLAFYVLAFAIVRGDLVQGNAADLSLHLYFAAMVMYVGGMFLYFAYFAYRREALRWLAIAVVGPGALLHLGAIVARGFADGHYPLANMYEYSSMLALVAVTVFLLMTVRWPVASLGGGLALFVVVALMGIGFGLYQSPEPLVPALQSYWLKIHVTSMMASSGILVSSFVFAALYLVKDRSESAKSWLNGSAIAARLPSLETLDRRTFRAILLGYAIWTSAAEPRLRPAQPQLAHQLVRHLRRAGDRHAGVRLRAAISSALPQGNRRQPRQRGRLLVRRAGHQHRDLARDLQPDLGRARRPARAQADGASGDADRRTDHRAHGAGAKRRGVPRAANSPGHVHRDDRG